MFVSFIKTITLTGYRFHLLNVVQVMVFFPKMLSGMDPEQMKELQQEMNANGDPMKSFKKLVGMEPKDEDED